MEPARTIIKSLGGARKVAHLLGVHRTAVYKWTWTKEKGGTGGLIPFNHARKVIDAAKECGLSLTADDFLPLDESAAT